MLRQPHDRCPRAGFQIRQRREFLVLGLLDVGIDRPAVRAAVRIPEPLLDPLHHVVGERVPEQVSLHVRLGCGVTHEVSEQPLDDAVLANDALRPRSALSGPSTVSRASPAASVSSVSAVGAKNPLPIETRLVHPPSRTSAERRGLTNVPNAL